MHHNYEVDVRLSDLRKEMVKHMLLIHAIQEEKRRKSATKIQAAYRGLLGRRVGKRFLKAGRRKMREAHRQRKVWYSTCVERIKARLSLVLALPHKTQNSSATVGC